MVPTGGSNTTTLRHTTARGLYVKLIFPPTPLTEVIVIVHIYVCKDSKPGAKSWQQVQEPIRKATFHDLSSLLVALWACYGYKLTPNQKPTVQYKNYLQGTFTALSTSQDYEKFCEQLAEQETKAKNTAVGIWISCPVSNSYNYAYQSSFASRISKECSRNWLAVASQSRRYQLRPSVGRLVSSGIGSSNSTSNTIARVQIVGM